MRGVYPDLHAPKGTKRIGETNRMVWKSRERVGGRGRKAVGILPFPPPTTGAISLETGEKGNAAFSFSPGIYFATDGNRFKPVWMYITKLLGGDNNRDAIRCSIFDNGSAGNAVSVIPVCWQLNYNLFSTNNFINAACEIGFDRSSIFSLIL
mgnify:CR=1 FL=1